MSEELEPVALTNDVMGSFAVAKVFREHHSSITSVDFDYTGRLCITAGEDDMLHVYDCESGRHRQACPSKKYGVELARFVHHSNHVLHTSTKIDDTIRFLSLHDNSYVRYFKGHTSRVVSLDVNPVNDTFISAAIDDSVRLWDIRSPTCQGRMKIQGAPCVAFDPQGVVFAVGLDGKTIRLYDPTNFDKGPFDMFRQLEPLHRAGMRFTHIKFANDGFRMLVCTNADVHYILDAYNGSVQQTLTGFANSGLSIEASFTPDSKYVIGGSEDGNVYVWEVESGLRVASFVAHKEACTALRFNPRFCMFASVANELALWLPTNNGLPAPPMAASESA